MNAIEVDHIYKKFTRSIRRSMYYGTVDMTKSMLGVQYDPGELRKGEFWSLEDINFAVKEGDALGIIGSNGSGKTTLLRMLNGIFPPDRGRIRIAGRIGALIAVSAGFHPHMSGRENVYLNGAILGMSRAEIKQKFDEIVAFADIGEFIDAPVATYSSGMNVRLGFAIAIHSNPDILLADEALAVGDLSFTLKCYRKIAEFRDQGGTIVLVSHSMSLIRNTCDHALWLNQGRVQDYGDTQGVCDQFENLMLQKGSEDVAGTGAVINNDTSVHLSKVEYLNAQNQLVNEVAPGELMTVRVHYDCARPVIAPIFSVSVLNAENIAIISNFSSYDGLQVNEINGKGYVDFTIPTVDLKPGMYRTTITFTEKNDINNILEWHDKSYPFVVKSAGNTFFGQINPHATWKIVSDQA